MPLGANKSVCFLFSFCQFFVDFKQLGNYFPFGHFLGEAVGLHDGTVVFLVGLAEVVKNQLLVIAFITVGLNIVFCSTS